MTREEVQQLPVGTQVRRAIKRYARGFVVPGWQFGVVRWNAWPRLGVIFEGETLVTILTDQAIAMLDRSVPMKPSRLESKKAGDVATVSQRLREAIACGTCRLGIAVDIVGRYWDGNGAAFDWVEDNGGHSCALLREGMTAAQEATVKKIEDAFMGRERAA